MYKYEYILVVAIYYLITKNNNTHTQSKPPYGRKLVICDCLLLRAVPISCIDMYVVRMHIPLLP